MSGAVLGVTLLAGMATLGASVFIVKGENKELQERKADEAFAKSKLPYDFSLNRDGIERLRNLRGPLLLQAVKDPRMDTDRISRMTAAEFEELARSREDVPLILKESPEFKMRDLVDKLFDVLKSGKDGSGKVIAWVLMIHKDGPSLLDGESKLDFAEAAAALVDMYNDPAFRFKDRCRVALTACIDKKTDIVGAEIVKNDVFLRAFPDNRMMAKLMRYMDNKSSTQLANMEVVKRVMFDEQDLRYLINDLREATVVQKFMKDYYMQRFVMRITPVDQTYTCDTHRKFTARVGASGANLDASGNIVEDKVSQLDQSEKIEDGNLITMMAAFTGGRNMKMTVERAFGYKQTIDKVNISL